MIDINNFKKHYMEKHHRLLSEEKDNILINNFKKHNRSLLEERYNTYINNLNDLYEFEFKSYIEYRRHLTTICDEENLYGREENVRSILADLIKNYYSDKFIHVLYKIWQRLNEIRLNEELYYQIMSM